MGVSTSSSSATLGRRPTGAVVGELEPGVDNAQLDQVPGSDRKHEVTLFGGLGTIGHAEEIKRLTSVHAPQDTDVTCR